LPRSEFGIEATFSATHFAKIEQVREDLMRRRGEFVDDSEALSYIVDGHVMPERDVAQEAKRAAACEQEETPEWLRHKVLARDGHRCQACGSTTTGRLHAHHIVFRSQGGLTTEDNLTTACAVCHGLIHEGRLFVKGRPASGVEFHNRFGDPLMMTGRSGETPSLPQPVLRLLSEDVLPQKSRDECGGQPPRQSSPAAQEPRYLSEAEIPDVITGEWFKEHMHLYEPGRDGVWRLSKSARR
jgi:hypothetical protein